MALRRRPAADRFHKVNLARRGGEIGALGVSLLSNACGGESGVGMLHDGRIAASCDTHGVTESGLPRSCGFECHFGGMNQLPTPEYQHQADVRDVAMLLSPTPIRQVAA